MRREPRRYGPWLTPFVGVMVASCAARVVVLATTSPSSAADSFDYWHLAHLIVQGRLATGQGSRVPGYSIFIVAFDFSSGLVHVAQVILGLAITAALFWLIWGLTENVWLASIGGLL